jgi:hypothetical protein
MAVSSIGSSIVSTMAAQAMVLKEAQTRIEVEAALLSDAMEIQEEMMKGLLQSMGIGQNVDIVV